MRKEEKNTPEINLDDLSFEKAMTQLDETVRSLGDGGLSLLDAISLFEKGMKLARLCSERLAEAELKITRIQTAYGEQMRFFQEGQKNVGE